MAATKGAATNRARNASVWLSIVRYTGCKSAKVPTQL